MLLHSAISSTLNGFFVFVEGEKTKKDAAGRWGGGMMAGGWSRGEGWRRRGGEEGGGRLVVLVVRVCGGCWCDDNQSLLLHRF